MSDEQPTILDEDDVAQIVLDLCESGGPNGWEGDHTSADFCALVEHWTHAQIAAATLTAWRRGEMRVAFIEGEVRFYPTSAEYADAIRRMRAGLPSS